ncbi:Xaa-Pro aminopeptidase [Tistlia consotensis]|uniref:Xaa-Pro aminopeptidase n=1 Tax=Tistlia consotensis USBA 355 TaxID=560819 RepID=A0A1Y6BK51_9PROT|nr:Xaa-Pro peptidase family protein [Tistlia consotensis]SMF07869.1 Xaa-Pro aminopeptidase [Tistlia consotensis USBA 355]SNR35672.1 Xaa-Pro aminopeptidase [Tistlia consotensis]
MDQPAYRPDPAFPAPPAPDETALRLGRLARLRQEMARYGYPAVVLTDPHNVRYASGARNMTPFLLRNPARYLFVPLEGPVTLFEFEGCEHLEAGNPAIDEIRVATTVSYVARAELLEAAAARWAAEIAELMSERCPGESRLGVERIDPLAVHLLRRKGYQILDAQKPVERARAVKTPEELVCIRRSLACVMSGEAKLRDAIRPGLSEQQLWSVLHREVIAGGADYVETRLLTSGPRTNPWFQETGERILQAGELVAHDTDVVGPHGYYADFSRTFLVGDGPASDDQRRLYGTAFEQLHHNLGLIAPGKSFREITEAAWTIPERYYARRYYLLMHGNGPTGEYPYLVQDADYDSGANYDGVVVPNMTLSVESFIGDEAGGEGVKLEQQVLVTETGIELLSPFPFEERLLGREV